MNTIKVPFNRCIGLVVLDVTMSNPNGDPDMESDPRTMDSNGHGLITPVSFKRKLRDLVDGESPVFQSAAEQLNLQANPKREFEILEKRGRDREKIKSLKSEDFQNKYWDARLFGNTFLESLKKTKNEPGQYDHFIRTGVIQVGVGTSIAKVEIERLTLTSKSGVQTGLDRGMAPLGFRVVRHGIYTIPFFVNPTIAHKTGADNNDLELFKFLVPHVYQHTASAIRPQVTVLHAWFAEHKNPLGSCPEYKLIDALTPTVNEGVNEPSDRHQYRIPGVDTMPPDVLDRFNKVIDLCNA